MNMWLIMFIYSSSISFMAVETVKFGLFYIPAFETKKIFKANDKLYNLE